MSADDPTPAGDRPAGQGFSEKDFYLSEFRGRSLGLALPGALADVERRVLEQVLAELDRNHTRSVLMAGVAEPLERITGAAPVRHDEPDWVGAVWRRLRKATRAGVLLKDAAGADAAAARAAGRMRLAKLVYLDAAGGLEEPAGERLSFVDLPTLDSLLDAGSHRDSTRLCEIRRLLQAGFPSITICSIAGLAEELFTYAGSGTFFTRERYADVRRLALDELEAAHDLIARGVEEGYLVPRSADALDRVLSNAFGVFVEGRFLAGIGALLPHGEANAGEIGSLYTLTRFLGEGVGAHLVRFAVEEARSAGYAYLFACTTSDRVARFFERNGFRSVSADRVPATKWRDYDPTRRDRVICLRRELEPASSERPAAGGGL